MQKKSDCSVIIIGAGISGLAAARELKSKGIAVRILESRDRKGGRILSETMTESGIITDLGASWIHGIGPGAGDLEEWQDKCNPIYSIARENEILTKVTSIYEADMIETSYWWKSTPVTYEVDKLEKLIYKHFIRNHSLSEKHSLQEMF